jgi:hypothetical protein
MGGPDKPEGCDKYKSALNKKELHHSKPEPVQVKLVEEEWTEVLWVK